MKLDTLYKRTKTGDIQYWNIRVETSDTGGGEIIKESGKLGTDKPVTHREIVDTGKQKRSAKEQAEFQANSDWKKKRDEGYKSLEDLNQIVVGPTENAGEHAWKIYNDILKGVLDRVLPQFNTDASGNVKPMLAKDWAGGKNLKYPCYVQPKLDGVRCLMIVTRQGPDLDVKFLSRSGKEYTTLGHIAEEVINSSVSDPFILDGEIYSDELTFQEITQAVKKQYPNSLRLHFRAYDVVSEENQIERLLVMQNIVKDIGSLFIRSVQTVIAEKSDHVKFHHDDWVGRGYEGAMIRLFNGTYDQGQRSSSLLKVKEFDETEFDFIQFEKGQRDEDLLAVCKHDAHTFRAKMVGNRKLKKKYEAMEGSLIGTKITIKHFSYTDDGLPRFPIGKSFRDYE
jgi:ATP-dependent DNA ligase